MMTPRFTVLPEIKVAGLGASFVSILSPKRTNNTVIPALWHQFVQRQDTIPHRTSTASLGLVEMLPADAAKSDPLEMFYIAAAPVSTFTGLPADLLQRTVAAGRYALFTHVGTLDRLGGTMAAIYRDWLPQAEQKLREGPHLEWYDLRFDLTSEKSEFDILLPVA